MNTNFMQKIYVVIATLLILGYFGYSIFWSSSSTATGPDLSGTVIVGQDILSLVARLKTISIDQSFFSSPLFVNLQDSSVTLFPESQGRANPFAPIGVER